MKNRSYLAFLLFLPLAAGAQTPTDALYMSHRQICFAGLYGRTQWNQYWEGGRKRENANMGTVTHQSAMLMGAAGISPRLNFLAMLPYIASQASQGQLAGQQGIQDLSIWLKYRVIDRSVGPGKLKVFTLGGASAPLSDYVPDFLPMCIGLGARAATARAIVDYRLKEGFYLTLRAGHTWRSNIFIDRDAYLYNDKLYYTNEVPLPNIVDAGALLGWRKGPWVSALTFDHFNCLSGDDIRPNDMPFPANRMGARSVGAMGKYEGKHWGVTASASQVFAGRNTGRNTILQAGLLYRFELGSDAR
jgi:hypothetical protein